MMKHLRNALLHGVFAVLLLTAPLSLAQAANIKTTVSQVSGTITLSDDVDYIVTDATPFASNGVVNIANTEHAVLILDQVKPSAAIKLLSGHVQIDGQQAVQNQNCQVKLYNRGCIILPYGNSVKPLTVYSEQNFGGEAVNDFGLENSGGFMNTLSAEKLNNRIRSFKLKRGYMVTFANRSGGRGYSRCFIAADEDLEVAKLPGVLDRSISSYRIFKWYDTGKQCIANDTRAEVTNVLNVTSCYSFSLGENRLPDVECVPHHIYEDWPSAAACGTVEYSPHLKTNNEPGNSADDHPQSVETILDNWENLMRTGMRLCSPSSHDGSLQHLRDFLNAVDERGWRCDIIDLHCYWPEWNFYNSIKGWADTYRRPIWISEWVWGASWNNNGIFGEAQGSNRDNPTAAQLNKNCEVVRNICEALNGYDYIERYYYWNSEANCSKLYYGGKLTPTGEYYSTINSGLAYNNKYNYAPRVPEQKDPSNFTVAFDKNSHIATLSWHDDNGELNSQSTIERRKSSSGSWEVIHEVALKDLAANYTFEDTEATNGCQYRIHLVDANYADRYSGIVTAASTDLGAGDGVEIDGANKYLGGNIILNGEFDMNTYGWFNGNGGPLTQPWFQAVPVGGINNSAYLQAYGSGAAESERSIKTAFDVTPGKNYYFSSSISNMSKITAQIALSEDGNKNSKTVFFISNKNTTWITQFKSFNTETYSKVLLTFSTLDAKAQFDNLVLAELFDTQEEAIADGIEKARMKADAFKAYNTLYSNLNDELDQQLAAATGNSESTLFAIERAVKQAIKAYNQQPLLNSLIEHAETLVAFGLDGAEDLESTIENARQALSAADILQAYTTLQSSIDEYLPLNDAARQPVNPLFTDAKGWTTKCGTYTGGDQRTNSKDNVTFWNAWWSGISADAGTSQTMEVKQDINLKGNNWMTTFTHGLYALECKASTEHYCLSDQHGYISCGDQTAVTPNLTADYFDLTSVSNDDRWQSLRTLPIYVDEDATVTIGFTGSKEGAIDNAFRAIGATNATGDKREGWWCATDFVLKHHPIYRTETVPYQWGVICLPYNFTPGKGVTLYQIAGVSNDYSYLCLEEIESSKAGVACIYRSDNSEAVFLESGASKNYTIDGNGNLYGILKLTVKAPEGSYVLQDGTWTKVGSDGPRLPNFSGFIRSFSDKNSSTVPVVYDWTGITMPIVGVTDEEKSINAINTPVITALPNGFYTLDGRRVNGVPTKAGIYIKVENQRQVKMMIK